MERHLLDYVIKGYDLNLFKKVIVFTDSIPVQRKRRAIEKTIKKFLARRLPIGVTYYIFHHASKSNYDLQIVDYCNWAIYRKWEMQDLRSYQIICRVIKSEFDIFRTGENTITKNATASTTLTRVPHGPLLSRRNLFNLTSQHPLCLTANKWAL